ncbi:MAG: thioredoxin family protein [Bacteroidales bacterium]|nr:thioredoxin family protein [Bacteroidales bacterium]
MKIKLLSSLCLFILLTGCGNTTNQKEKNNSSNDTLHVYCFYGKQRCPTCIAIEKFTQELIEQQYATDIKTGRIKFQSVSIDENEALADKYEVAWSSLILDKNGTINNLTDMGFKYARNNPNEFKARLEAEIDKLLQ